MEYEEAEISEPGHDVADEAVIVRDFSEIPDPEETPRRTRWIRVAAIVVALLLLLVFYRGCTADQNTPDSELSSTRAQAGSNLKKAAASLKELAPTRGSSADTVAIKLEDLAQVPVGVGSANEPGEIGVKIRGNNVILETETSEGRKFSIYRMK